MAILSTVIARGTRAAQPAASGAAAGSLYYVTDEKVIERSTGSAWESFSLAATDIPNDATLVFTDITTNNSSTSKHGFLKKLDNDATHFMDGQGNWSVPAGSSSGAGAPNFTKRQFWMQASDISSLTLTSGKDLAGLSTTVLGSGIANVLQDSTSTYFLFSTTASTNNTTGFADNGLTPFRWDHLPDMTAYISTGTSIANMRFWFGISSSSSLNTDTPSASSIQLTGFRYSTVAGDTNWMACTEQGSGSSATRSSTGVAVATSTYVSLRVKWASTSSVEFYVNGTLTNTIATTLPTVTTPVFPVLYAVTLENVIKSFKMSRVWIQAN